jgi:hypothetical protein
LLEEFERGCEWCNKKAAMAPLPPPPKDEIVAPPFKWVTKGEKGFGHEPGIDADNESK